VDVIDAYLPDSLPVTEDDEVALILFQVERAAGSPGERLDSGEANECFV